MSGLYSGNTSFPTRVDVALGPGGGKWIVPWISSSARPLGVWRMGGRGFGVVGADGGVGAWRGIVGIVCAVVRGGWFEVGGEGVEGGLRGCCRAV